MQLNRATDYALRVLLYLAVQGRAEFVSTRAIAEAFAISDHHLRKVTRELVEQGWLEARRGAQGGVRLACEPADLRLGAVVRRLEGFELLECFDAERNTCHIAPACRLKGALHEGLDAFFAALDAYTLAEMVDSKPLRRLLKLAPDEGSLPLQSGGRPSESARSS